MDDKSGFKAKLEDYSAQTTTVSRTFSDTGDNSTLIKRVIGFSQEIRTKLIGLDNLCISTEENLPTANEIRRVIKECLRTLFDLDVKLRTLLISRENQEWYSFSACQEIAKTVTLVKAELLPRLARQLSRLAELTSDLEPAKASE